MVDRAAPARRPHTVIILFTPRSRKGLPLIRLSMFLLHPFMLITALCNMQSTAAMFGHPPGPPRPSAAVRTALEQASALGGPAVRAAFASASAGAWNPFLRRIFYNMDNCAGTNKSQFCFGGIALLAMSGNLDTILLMFQLQGHTKFDPDIAAQKTAGAFNSRDTFNHGMLNKHFSDHVTTIAYDHKLLKDWKAATPDIFEPVDNITSYHTFMLLADDGKVDLGEPLKKTTPQQRTSLHRARSIQARCWNGRLKSSHSVHCLKKSFLQSTVNLSPASVPVRAIMVLARPRWCRQQTCRKSGRCDCLFAFRVPTNSTSSKRTI